MLRVVTALAVLATLAWWISGRGEETDGRNGPSAVGDAVIEEFLPSERELQTTATGLTLTGATYRSEDLLGDVVVYNVWGSWCGPCVKEAPDLVSVANEYPNVRFVGLNVRDNDASARAFEATHDVPYDSVVSSDSGPVMLSFGTTLAASAVPSTLVVDRLGRVAARVIGPVTAATLRALIDPVLAEAPG